MEIQTVKKAVAAYGGAQRWDTARTITAKGTLTGFLFRAKTRMPRPNMTIECRVHEPWTRLEPIDRWGHVGILDGTGVRLEDSSGKVLKNRPDARSYFPGGRRLIHWDALDLTYFLGYAIWNYFALPALLMRDDIKWRELEAGILDSKFPPNLPTHGKQRHFFDSKSGLLTRYDYMPVVAFKEARAANVVLERGNYKGIPYESHRKVYILPRELGGKYIKHPVMVNMHFWDWKLN
jgi:hypothetical protein